jgi:ABC-type Mn2+/Zn2+ transport system permease subunit
MAMSEAWTWLSDPWSQAFMQHAFTEVALVGLVGGWLGCWVLLYGVSYSAESLSHGMFPGLVGASLLGLPLVAGGAVGAGAAAAGIAGLGNARGIDRDTSVGVVITSLFGLGALLALAPSSPPGIQELLFGDVLAVSRRDLLVTALIALPVFALLWVLHARLLAVGFDRSSARAIGIAPRPVELVVMLLVAAAVVVSVQALGSLLVVAVLVAPAACARLLTRRLAPMVWVSAAVAVAGGVAGLYLSYYAGTAGGASIALCLVGAYLVALAADAALGGRRAIALKR